MKKKKIITSALIICILTMSIGYASFASNLEIKGVTKIDGEWEIKITNIKATEVCDSCDAGTPTYDDTKANFNAKLTKPGDSITYEITIKNTGTIDAKLDEIELDNDKLGSPAFIYTTEDPSDTLNVNDSTTYKITITYDPNITTIPDIKDKDFTSTIKYIQK